MTTATHPAKKHTVAGVSINRTGRRMARSADHRQVTATVFDRGPPPVMLEPDVLSHAVYWCVTAVLEEAVVVQLEPVPQAARTDPLSFTMSIYQTVSPTSTFVEAVSVTLEFTDGDPLLAVRPLRHVPSDAQLLPDMGVLVAVAPVPVQLTVTVAVCGPPPAMPLPDVLSHAVYWWLAATLDVTPAAQLVPVGQLLTMAPDSFTMSMYHTVGPTS